LRASLIELENRGVIEATEERHPAHFHVAVLNQQRPQTRIASAAQAVSTKTPVAATSAKITTVSNGEVAAPEKKEVSAAAKKAAGTTYTVRAGDNLWNIARKHGTTPDRIQELNGLKGSRLRVKQVLKLP
jgi:LysM repeat protein